MGTEEAPDSDAWRRVRCAKKDSGSTREPASHTCIRGWVTLTFPGLRRLQNHGLGPSGAIVSDPRATLLLPLSVLRRLPWHAGIRSRRLEA